MVTGDGKTVEASGRYMLKSLFAFDRRGHREAIGAAALPTLPFVVGRMPADAAPGPDDTAVL